VDERVVWSIIQPLVDLKAKSMMAVVAKLRASEDRAEQAAGEALMPVIQYAMSCGVLRGGRN